MARYYDVMLDFGERGRVENPEDGPDSVQVSPFAVLAVWRYRYPVTFSRAKGESFSKSPADITRLRDPVLVVVEDIQNLQVTTTKTNHVNQLNATLFNGANYLVEIFPGDWVAAWMVNDAATAQDLIKRIQNSDRCNRWQDGLKFLGRISAIRKRISQAPGGLRVTTYSLNAAGFTELDASIYYEPALASQSVGLATDWLRKTGIEVNDIIKKSGSQQNQSSGGIDVNALMPMLLHAFYGSGVPKNQGFQSSAVPDTNQGLNNPNAFVIPEPVAAILGVTKGTKPNGLKSWTDICDLLMGIQKYKMNQTSDSGVQGESAGGGSSNTVAGSVFTPDGTTGAGSGDIGLHKCPDDLLGTFLPSVPQFNGQRTVWSLLQQFLNPTVNEMYATLRPNAVGNVVPTLVIRQLPFNSGILDETYKPKVIPATNQPDQKKKGGKPQQKPAENPVNSARKLALTRFAELPRWIISPVLIRGADLGRSDSLRFNFVHIYGETGLQSQNKTGYIVRDPPVTDDMDIMRAGFRPYMVSVNCAPADANSRKAGDWMYIMSDIVMGQHLTLTGTMDVVGLHSPICPGDNVEFDGHVLHIEAVSHSFAIQPGSGMKTFTTSLALSHGLKADQLQGGDFSMFSGTDSGDLREYEAPTSRDYRVNKTEPNSPPSAVAEGIPDSEGQTQLTDSDQPPEPGYAKTGIDADAFGEKLQNLINKKTWGF